MKRPNKFPDIERWLGNLPIAERVVIRHRKKPGGNIATPPRSVLSVIQTSKEPRTIINAKKTPIASANTAHTLNGIFNLMNWWVRPW
jgi:hypothetical protein